MSGLTEETEALEIDLVEDAAALQEALTARGLDARLDGNRVTLERVSGDDYDVIRDAIVESGALLYRLAPARLMLADVFSATPDDAGAGEGEAA